MCRTYLLQHLVAKSVSNFCEKNTGIIKDISTNSELVEIQISEFLGIAHSGDSIQLTISKISDELFAIQCDGKVLYKVSEVPSAVWIQQPLFLSLIGVLIFMLIVVNLKNPKGRLKKLQEEMNIC